MQNCNFINSKDKDKIEAVRNVTEVKSVVYISFCQNVFKVRCGEIGYSLDYLNIFQNRYLSKGMVLYLVNI